MASSKSTQQDDFSYNEIIGNLDYLSKKITNLNMILILLIKCGIISEDERELIDSKKTTLTRNNSLLVLMTRKNWPNIRAVFLKILRQTSNEHCANIIEGTMKGKFDFHHSAVKIDETLTEAFDFQTNDKLDSRWWPEVKELPKAFHQRKSENVLLTKKLKEMLSQDKNDGVAVITQKVTVSGLGGIGKTTTAIWFAQEYQVEYNHILWIDCGEGRLLNTFKRLAEDLKVQQKTEVDLKDLASKCFKVIARWKCLWIFDNAECYIGKEGVKDALPKSIKNFDILITSRHQEWGNANGDGEIPQFLMNVFDQNEGVEFMKTHINNLSEKDNRHIEQLGNLLGNHPLALQIAVATLNRQKLLNLENYIDRIKKSPELLHIQFDTYEKTIDRTMKISLDLIQNHESNKETNIGAVAYKIMTIFAFITPDEVPADFFLAVETRQTKPLQTFIGYFKAKNVPTSAISNLDIDAATDLLEKYSLLTRSNFVADQYTLSVHRLLQQVVRHNENEAKQQIIKQILNCKGFLNYKLIPFSYADQSLQNKFKTIRAELIDKLRLNQLLKEGRFTEAVELSRIIKNVLKDHVSRYNFAVCLRHNLELQQSEKELESLLNVINGNEKQTYIPGYYSDLGIIHSSGNVYKYHKYVRSQLFVIYFMNKNFSKAREAANQWSQLTLPFLPLNELIAFIGKMSLPWVFLQMHENKNCVTFRVNDGSEHTTTLELHSWIIDTKIPHIKDIYLLPFTEIIIEDSTVDIGIIPLPLKKLQLKNCILVNNSHNSVKQKTVLNNLEHLSLVGIFVKREIGAQCTTFDISYLISPTLKTLKVKDISCKCSCLRISLLRLTSIKFLDLAGCAVVYVPDIQISPTELTLTNVRIISEIEENMLDGTVNQFVEFKQMKCLHLNGMSIDFNERVKLNELTLINTKVINWEQGMWVVGKVRTFPNLGFTQMEINQLESMKAPGIDKNSSSIEIKKEKLLQFLKSISGSKTITGLYSIVSNQQVDLERIQSITGVLPGILTRYTFSPEVNKLQSLVEDTISNWNNSYLVHIRLCPDVLLDILKDGSDTSWMDLIEEGGNRNKLWKKELDTYGYFLHQLQVAEVVPIFDLLPNINCEHESYHWSGRRGLNGSSKLLQITKDYLTQHHGLTSFLLAWSVSVNGDMTRLQDYWPGNSYVDVATVDMGRRGELSSTEYQALLDVVGDKPIGMDRMFYVPSPKLLAKQSRWTWFTLNDYFIDEDDYNSKQNTKKTFNSPIVINRDSLHCKNCLTTHCFLNGNSV